MYFKLLFSYYEPKMFVNVFSPWNGISCTSLFIYTFNYSFIQ